jgi:hypothetical protein
MIIDMLLSSCAAWVWVYGLKMYRFKWKPFNCEFCMAGWIALAHCWDGWHTPLWMAGAMVGVIILTSYLKKI